MKYSKSITLLVICISVLAVIVCLCGFFFTGGQGAFEFRSIRGEIIEIDGSGLYQYESMNQRLALYVQDIVTLALGIPLLIISLCLSLAGSLKGRLLLTGTAGYFLYTYMTYTFLRMYNPMFIIYVMLMSASLFTLILSFMSFDIEEFSSSVGHRIPVRFIGGYQILLALGLMFTWLPPIVDSLINSTIPLSLEHNNTLGYEAIDLGLVVPALFVSAILLMKRKPIGYLFSSVIIMLSITMNILISVLTAIQVLNGMKMPMVMILMFPVFTVVTAICLVLILKNIQGREPSLKELETQVSE